MLGFPVAYTLAGTSLLFAGIGLLTGTFDAAFLHAMPNRLFGILSNQILVAVPLFVFMGVMLEKSRIAEKLLRNLGLLFGPMRGGLGFSVIIVGMLLAASTGIVGATVVTMGLISLPTMLRNGYSPSLASGTICATGTLGQIIPPSTALIILGDVLSSAYQQAQLKMGIFSPDTVSVADLFVGALIPGLMLVFAYLLYTGGMALFKPESAPAVQDREPLTPAILIDLLKGLLPPLLLIIAVLGSILSGQATPTEAAGIGALGSLILAIVYRQLNLQRLREVMDGTLQVTSMVFLIFIGAALFSLVFRGFGGEELVHEAFTNMPGGVFGAMLIVMLVIFLLGFILDFIEITFVVVPIVAPVLLAMGVDPVWLGIMIAINLQTSFLTPPFGFALFYLRGVAPAAVKTMQMYKGVVPFIGLQLIALVIVGNTPQLVNYLPNRVSLLSDNAPPPRNPKLGYCVDKFISKEIAANGADLLAIGEAAGEMDLSILPDDFANATLDSFDNVAKALAQLKLAEKAAEDVQTASVGYRPLHQHVRMLERDAASIDRAIETLEDRINDLPEGSPKAAVLNGKIVNLTADKDTLLAQIPSNWEDEHNAYQQISKAETKAYTVFRRLSQQSYAPVMETLDILNSGEAYRALQDELMASKDMVANTAPIDAVEPLADLAGKFSDVAGAGGVKSAISKARRAVKSKTPDKEKAQAQLDNAIALYQEQLEWRANAEAEIAPKLESYVANMRTTMGLREQRKFTREQALFVASCTSYHRDVSLNF
jgi:tripartite ATP-independent transporter DctM subunit